ncbi:uncharacterized protein LOC135498235 [Lineus longissimus]|uniref:uncharacterized protein LOC135498235 n=1 Tax=Lineus longissimus TaxID=88925 RepID=UPI00315DD17D
MALITKLKYVTAGTILTIAAVVLITTVKQPHVLKPSSYAVVTRHTYKRVPRHDDWIGFSGRAHESEVKSIVKTEGKAAAVYGSGSDENKQLLEEVAWSEVDDDSAEFENGEGNETIARSELDGSTELEKREEKETVALSEDDDDSTELENGEGNETNTLSENDDASTALENGEENEIDGFSEDDYNSTKMQNGERARAIVTFLKFDNDSGEFENRFEGVNDTSSERVDVEAPIVGGGDSIDDDGKLRTNLQLGPTNTKKVSNGRLEDIKGKKENIVLSSKALIERINTLRPLVFRRINESLARTTLFPSKLVDEIARNMSAGFLSPEQRLSEWRTPCWKKLGALHCLPSNYILGFQGCATNDLYFRLTAHTEVMPSWRAESQFWARDFDNSFIKSMSNYGATVQLKSMFQSKNNILLERNTRDTWRSVTNDGKFSPRYWNMLQAQMIKKFTPDAKFIVTLCNPITRIRHFYAREDKMRHKRSTRLQFHQKIKDIISRVTNCLEDKDLEECFKHQWAAQACLDYNYLAYLKDWLAVFPRDRFFFIKTEQWRRVKDRFNILKDLYKFLNIKTPSQHQLILQSAMHNIDDQSYRHHDPHLRHPLPKTIEVMEAFYKPFNKELANFLKDSRFRWQSW